jgi:hypothetical protein
MRDRQPVNIQVLDPPLESDEQGELPHVYPDGGLCLYDPAGNEWDRSRWIADTIIPWTSEWLYHYECWKVTCVWEGGGDRCDGAGPGERKRRPPE